MMPVIDLNSDMGESSDEAGISRETAMLQYISSANIACGGHAGDDNTMEHILRAAKSANVCVGAHPSYPDRAGFGRRSIDISHAELKDALAQQLMRLLAAANKVDVAVIHVKPHGTLYNDAADDMPLAQLIADLVKTQMPGGAIVGLYGGAMEEAARNAEIDFVAEGFIDRQYAPNARLLPRENPAAMITDGQRQITQAIALASGNSISDSEGGILQPEVGSLCLHSDSEGALESARAVNAALTNAGIGIKAPW